MLRPTQLIILSFLLASLAGCFLLMLPAAAEGAPLSFIDALFSSVTAICVTGLAVINTGADLTPFGHWVVLALIQVGGLGYMVLSTAFMMLMGQRIPLRQRLVLQEAMGGVAVGHVTSLLRAAVVVTFLTEAVGAALLTSMFRGYGMPWPLAVKLGVFHSVSAFCNAGLDLFGRPDYLRYLPPGEGSLTHFAHDPGVLLVTAVLIVLGGIGFVVVVDLLGAAREERRRLSLHTKIVLAATGVLIAGGALVILLLESGNPTTLGPLSWPDKLMAALFQSITARTAGFNTVSQASLFPASKLFTTALMFIGASPGGTGGGVKTTTFVVLVLAAASSVRGTDEVTAFKRRITHGSVYRSLAVMMTSALVVGSLTFSFGVLEARALVETRLVAGPTTSQTAEEEVSHQFLEYFFEATSAFGTVGLSTGITPGLSWASKLAVVITMLLGRVGPVTLAAALAERRRRWHLRHPAESVMIG